MITGNSGDNVLDGGLGNDTISGGEGNDSAVYNGIYANYTLRAGIKGPGTLQLEGIEVLDICSGSPAPVILQLHSNFSVLVRPSLSSEESNMSL